MSIIYLCIANQNNKSIIGSYNPIEIEKSSLKGTIEEKVYELINKRIRRKIKSVKYNIIK